MKAGHRINKIHNRLSKQIPDDICKNLLIPMILTICSYTERFAVILIPGTICLVILAVGVFYKYISKIRFKGKKDGGDR